MYVCCFNLVRDDGKKISLGKFDFQERAPESRRRGRAQVSRNVLDAARMRTTTAAKTCAVAFLGEAMEYQIAFISTSDSPTTLSCSSWPTTSTSIVSVSAGASLAAF